MKILVERIPQKVVEAEYFIHWKENEVYDADSLLSKYATLKGFFTGNGLPNKAISARNILKDYVNGVIVYARNPPGLEGEEVIEEKTNAPKAQELPDMKKKEQNL